MRHCAPADVVDTTAAGVVDCAFPEDDGTRVAFGPVPARSGFDPVPACLTSDPLQCTACKAFADQDVLVRVSVSGDDAWAEPPRILGTAMVLPTRWATVPFDFGASLDERVSRLEEAGSRRPLSTPPTSAPST